MKKELPDAIDATKFKDITNVWDKETKGSKRLTRDRAIKFFKTLSHSNECEEFSERALEESLQVLDGSSVYPNSDTDSHNQSVENNAVISSSGVSSYTSMDKMMFETPSRTQLAPSFEEEKTITITPLIPRVSPKGGSG